MTVPALAEVKVTAKWPFASVVPVNGPAGLAAAPLLFVRRDGHGLTGGGHEARAVARVLRRGSTVKVCGWLISLNALGVIEILALTQVLTAGPELRLCRSCRG